MHVSHGNIICLEDLTMPTNEIISQRRGNKSGHATKSHRSYGDQILGEPKEGTKTKFCDFFFLVLIKF